MSRVSPLLLALLSGALLSAAYRVPDAWPLSFVALVPLFLVIYQKHRTSTIFWSGALVGILLMGTATSWFFSALPLPAILGTFAPLQAFLFVFASWVLVVLVTGPVVGLWALIIRPLSSSRVLDALGVAILFVAGEYVRMFTFNLLTFSTTISNPLFFSVGFLGYPLMDSGAWRELGMFGVGAMSLVVVLINLAFYALIRNRAEKRYWLGALGLAAAIALISFLPVADARAYFAAPSKTVRVAVFSIPRPEGLDDDPAFTAQIRLALPAALAEQPDLVLLPEDSELFTPFSSATLAGSGVQAAIIDSGTLPTPDGRRLEEAFVDTSTTTTLIRAKVIFTPQGEYLPALGELILGLAGSGQAIERFQELRSFAQGSDGTSAQINGISASLLFCLEILKPGFGAQLASEQGSALLLVPSSHDWFHDSPAFERDTLRFERAQALAAGVPLAVSTDQAPAYIIDRYGRILASAGGAGQFGGIVANVPIP